MPCSLQILIEPEVVTFPALSKSIILKALHYRQSKIYGQLEINNILVVSLSVTLVGCSADITAVKM